MSSLAGVCLFVSMQDYAKTTQCHKIRWKGVTWAKTEMIRFWC